MPQHRRDLQSTIARCLGRRAENPVPVDNLGQANDGIRASRPASCGSRPGGTGISTMCGKSRSFRLAVCSPRRCVKRQLLPVNSVGKSGMRPAAAHLSPANRPIVIYRRIRTNVEHLGKYATGPSAMQNTSHAVMAQRAELKNSLDDFPTPPWATRALVKHVIVSKASLAEMTCLEPACGRGHMAVALADYFKEVTSYDVFDYGFSRVADFLKTKIPDQSFDWVITNPPFRLGEEFISRSMNIARRGVAMLTRTVFIESVGRYERLFKSNPPSQFAQFTERVPMVKGRVDKKASTATGYAWLVWEKDRLGRSEVVWIPPCRKTLERDGDYQQAPLMPTPKPSVNVIPMRRSGEGDLFSGATDGGRTRPIKN